MSEYLAAALEEAVRDLLRERAELEQRINADLDRVEAIDTIVCGFRAVSGPGGSCHVPEVFAPAGGEAGAVCVSAVRSLITLGG
ncbi:MAG TPA: DEK C-terminal domain-containing protein [Longimicrobium sp.]|nr:DEK C-terminal domain-containing protein [Longimicrobium sp.]